MKKSGLKSAFIRKVRILFILDFEKVYNLKNYSKKQVKNDINTQIEIEKARVLKRESKSEDFAKDPTNIEVKTRENFYKVSKFRQI
jgi:hypothetical protein